MAKKETLINRVIKALDNLKEAYPEVQISIETPNGGYAVTNLERLLYMRV